MKDKLLFIAIMFGVIAGAYGLFFSNEMGSSSYTGAYNVTGCVYKHGIRGPEGYKRGQVLFYHAGFFSPYVDGHYDEDEPLCVVTVE